MILKVKRRFLLIRLVLSFVLDYWKIERLKKKLTGEECDREVNRICHSAGKRMRNTAFRLKGIIVKVGQFLSMRQDLLPQAFIQELTDLQDSLPAEPFQKIRPSIEQELKTDIFKVFREFEHQAIGAASLAQVHRAVLQDGTKVAVKILRPRMEELAQADLDTLGLIAKVAQRLRTISRKMNFVLLHREFTEVIHRELNGYQESENLQRFAAIFANDKQIIIPKIFETYTTRRLIVMEYVEGARVTDRKLLSEWEIDGPAIVKTLLNAYIQQLLVHGFIHVDPHPGNLLILPKNHLCFLDFGMVNQLTVDEVNTLRSLLQNILFQNVDGILSDFEHLGFIKQGADNSYLTSIINHVLSQLNKSDRNGEVPELSSVISGLKTFIQDHSIQLQAKYMFLIRGTGILITTLSLLAPRSNWMELLFDVVPPIIMEPVQVNEAVYS